MNLPLSEDERNQQLMRDCHEIAIRPGFGNQVVVKFRSYGQMSTTLTVPAHAVTVHGDGRIEFHKPPQET